jgi:hypothetical protein
MTGTSVVFDERGLVLDGERVPIIAGEFHYWRHNAVYWPRILDRLLEAGVGMVSTFVCWDAHERERGRFDFAGETDPALDLGGFIDLCAEKGMKVLIRVGPIIDAFWPTRGPARDVAALERFEEEYRARTLEYLDHVMQVIAPRQATRGGNVVMICLDNEVYYPYVTVSDPDHVPEHDEIEVTYRRDCVLARYRDWLEGRVGTIEALNELCGTDYASFADVGDPDFRTDPGPLTMLAFEHINDSIAENFEWLRDAVVERGGELPMYCNMRAYTEFIDWHRVDGLIGSSGNQAFHIPMVPREHELVINWSQMLHRARTRFPWAAEHQAGMAFGLGEMDHVYGILPPEMFRFAGHLVTAVGSRSAAVTMFVECDWWHLSPVTPVGEVRKGYFPAARDHLETLARTGPDRRMADCALVWCQQDHQAYVATLHDNWLTLQEQVDSMSVPKEWPSWWTTFTALHDADCDFDLVVPAEEPADAPQIWVYAGSSAVGLRTLERIAAHVEGGGTLVVASELPERSHGGGAADDARVRELVAGLRASDRLVFASPLVLAETLDRLGATRYSDASAAGCRTYNYVADGYRDLWVVNNHEEPREVTVALDRPIENGLEELTAHRALQLPERAPAEPDGDALRVSLPPKTVRGFRFAR